MSKQVTITNYEQADAFLGKKQSRPLQGGSTTRLIRLGESVIGVKYHTTLIVVYFASGYTMLDSGGWRTMTTREKLDLYTPAHVRISNVGYVWDLVLRKTHDDGTVDWDTPGQSYVFKDGITIKANGTVERAGTDQWAKEQRELAKRIVRYAREYTRRLCDGEIRLGIANADCQLCIDGDSKWFNTTHLRLHVERNEFPPSLVLAVMAFYSGQSHMGYASLPDYMPSAVDSLLRGSTNRTDWFPPRLASRIRSYLRLRLGAGTLDDKFEESNDANTSPTTNDH